MKTPTIRFQSKTIFFLKNIAFPNTRVSCYFPKTWFSKNAATPRVAIFDMLFLSVLMPPDPHFWKKCDLELRLPKQIAEKLIKWFCVALRNVSKNGSSVVDGPQPETKLCFLIFTKKKKIHIFVPKKTRFWTRKSADFKAKLKNTHFSWKIQ